ncbi:hypothetical protein GCM10007199_18810 [Fictibacillus barbaricus]|nr:hypothetical protein GCM10007199_18810 [Fictibacillus barbaricus]
MHDIARKYAADEKEGLQFRVTKVNEKIIQYNKARAKRFGEIGNSRFCN